MAELKKCSRCRSEIELKYVGINRKGEHNKTCETCLNKSGAYQQKPEVQASIKEYKAIEVMCDNCGCHVNKGSISIHKRRFYCQIYNMETKPNFEELLIHQDYDRMLYEYKDSFEYILTNKTNDS